MSIFFVPGAGVVHPYLTRLVFFILIGVGGASDIAAGAKQNQEEAARESAAVEPRVAKNDAAKRDDILNSPAWRRVMFEFREWIDVQTIYKPDEIAKIQDRFNRRVAAMSADEIEELMADMEHKFEILNSPRAREAREWLASYIAVMSYRKRAEALREIPKMGSMSAAELQRELARIEQKRSRIERKQGDFRSAQQARVTSQLEQNRAAQPATRPRPAATTFSPYHQPSEVNAHLNSGRVGTRTGFSIQPGGQVRQYFNLSSW